MKTTIVLIVVCLSVLLSVVLVVCYKVIVIDAFRPQLLFEIKQSDIPDGYSIMKSMTAGQYCACQEEATRWLQAHSISVNREDALMAIVGYRICAFSGEFHCVKGDIVVTGTPSDTVYVYSYNSRYQFPSDVVLNAMVGTPKLVR